MMVEVRNNGVPLIEQAPKAAITQSIIALAEALCGAGDAADAAAIGKNAAVDQAAGIFGPDGRARPASSRAADKRPAAAEWLARPAYAPACPVGRLLHRRHGPHDRHRR